MDTRRTRGRASRLLPLMALLVWSCTGSDPGPVDPTSVGPDDLAGTQVDGSAWTKESLDTPPASPPASYGMVPGAALAPVSTSALLYPLPDDRTPNDGVANDGGWSLVDFCTAGATGFGSAQPPGCHHNDDDSAIETLPFFFEFYGTAYDEVYVNNNGNLSFGALYSAFSSSGFPTGTFRMVAPFWADVDTRETSDPTNEAGHVWYQMFGNTYVVTWDAVGHFSRQNGKTNTFQVAISDGLNPAMGIGNNVCFSYQDMQWTTGNASGGSGGFGGTPATVGVNRGNGVDFAQIGRFDHEGTDYDGPGGNADGVSYLDGKRFCLNVSGTNIPPVAQNFPADNTLAPQCGESLDYQVQFSGPEIGETVTVTVDDPDGAQADGLTITSVPGNPASVQLEWASGPPAGGTYQLVLTAEDDNPAGAETTVETLTIVWPSCNQPPVADPDGPYVGQAGVDIDFDGSASSDPDGDAITYDWDWGDGSSSLDAGAFASHTYADAGFYDVCLTVNDGLVDSDEVCTSVVVYDPAAGFVTGGGFIRTDGGGPSGKANFGFVAKYQKNKAAPQGNVEFQAGDLDFHSSGYDWLVVTPGYAVLSGAGTVGGDTCADGSDHRFQLWAGDGDPDTFRIRIWCSVGGVETDVYDNGFDQPTDGGNIVIHTK